MTLDPDNIRIARDRVSRVFHYLEAFNQHRNPAKRQIGEQLWTLWFRDLPDHPSIQKGVISRSPKVSPGAGGEAVSDPGNGGDDFILKVRRPTLTRAPKPPEVIAPWLEHGWEEPTAKINLRPTRNEVGEKGEARIVQFGDDPQRPRAFEAWKARREEWVRNEIPAREAMKIFEQIYENYGRMEREAERVELILGDGILSWHRTDGGVYHPILLQRLQLDFNPSLPEFVLIESEHDVELYSALLGSMPDVDGKGIARCREELAEGDYHPLGDDGTSGFLKRFVIQLSPRGEFVDKGAPQGDAEDPQVGRDPVIFLRERTLGFATAIDAVIEDIENREDLPNSLLNVVGVESSAQQTPGEKSAQGSSKNESEDILFSKAANPEQFRIAEQLERHGSVLVQGPPGTGKSHTIANLIGHLLAQGKNVLVTSHATKALRVLRGHVVEKLRPLCVSVLESDIESRNQLEGSVEAIVRRLSTSSYEQLEEEAALLDKRRRELMAKLGKVRQELVDARADEYRDILIAGQSYSPSDAARKVTQEEVKNDWIPGPILPGTALPLSEGEIIDLYRTNQILSAEDEVELTQILPNTNELVTPEYFEWIVKEKERLSNLDINFRSDLWESPPTKEGLEEIEALTERIRQAVEYINGTDKWKIAVISAGRTGGAVRRPWDNLLSMIENVCNLAGTTQEILLRYGPVLSRKMALEQQKQIIEEILRFFQSNSKLSRLSLMMHSTWNQFIQESRVANRPPNHADHFRALASLVRLKISRQDLAGRWDRQLASLGAPSFKDFGEEQERVCAQFIPAIKECLGWYQNLWQPLEMSLKGLGFAWERFLGEHPPNLSPNGEILRLRDAVTTTLPSILSARANAIRACRLEEEIEALERGLVIACGDKTTSQALKRLRDAIHDLDSDAYRGAFQRLVDLHNLRTNHELRRGLLKRLEKYAPAWASCIRDRRGRHADRDIPGDPAAAWLWRQLHDELERRGKISLEELQQAIGRISDELRQVAAELIDRRAWAAQVKRTTLPQRQALIGWLDTVRKIGKEYGKRVPRLRAEARRKMSECRTAVPVWVMPLARVVENFDPRTTRFDVVIIDEASQCDVMALLALYLARKIVIVGDHEQVSPAAVGQDLGIVQHLIDEYLQGIPNAELYDGQMSIYDLARQSFGAAICLLEHFRCVPEIIQFSNQLSYKGEIKPLRDPSQVQLKPHVISYRVGASSSEKKVNTEEMWTVASLLAAAIEQPEYEGKTFGVISLVGEEQAREIERLLVRYLPPDEYQRRQILCGNAAHFQGDERKIMFLSMVDTNSGGGPLPFRDQPIFRQRFNVAASRACDQMWVIHSLDSKNDIKPGDLRRRLIEHAEDPSILLRAMEKGEERVQSELERGVLKRLIQAGYRVIPQWKAGYYWIDLVVEGAGRRLAIECDGDRFHPIEKLPQDMARQAILERLGWKFSRIRGSQFFRDPDSAMEPIFSRLKSLEILPETLDDAEKKLDPPGNALKERVIRRAQELRLKWQEMEFPEDQPDSRRRRSGPKNDGPRKDRKEDSHDERPQEPEDKRPSPHQQGLFESATQGAAKESPDETEQAWIVAKGAAALRKLHRWAKESGDFERPEVSLIHWVALDIDKKKPLSQANARKVKRLWEKAVRKGFIEK